MKLDFRTASCALNVISTISLIQSYVIKFHSDLRQVISFPWLPNTIKTNHDDIAEILLKLVFNTRTQHINSIAM
jgi:hypothetical protein